MKYLLALFLTACAMHRAPKPYAPASEIDTYITPGVERVIKSAARLRVYCDGDLAAYGSATAITPRHALTARHMMKVCEAPSDPTYTLQFDGGEMFRVSVLAVATNPDVDTILISDNEVDAFPRFSAPVEYQPSRGQHVWLYAGDGKADVLGEWPFILKEGRISRVLDGALVVSSHGVPGNSGCGVFDDDGNLLAVLWGGSWNPVFEFYFEAYRPSAWINLIPAPIY